MLMGATWHCRATATRRAYSTALRLTTGNTPGMPAHTGQTEVFGSARVESTTAQLQNIFERVPSSAWVSSPMTASNSKGTLPVAADKSLQAVQGLFDLLVSCGVGAAHKTLPSCTEG